MDTFNIYFELGYKHILDWQGYDHILFITALCGIYLLSEWKKVLILVTAFTLGHSITLALSVFDKILVATSWVEFLIPVTILITSLSNIIRNKKHKGVISFYLLPLFFGLIHGLGFSNYLKSLLGNSPSIITQLFAFNFGLEIGQIVIVLFVLLLGFIVTKKLKVKERDWNFFISSAIFGIAFIMAIQRFSF